MKIETMFELCKKQYKDSNSVHTFFIKGKEIENIWSYSGCRGHVYDTIQNKLNVDRKTFKLNKKYMYLYVLNSDSGYANTANKNSDYVMSLIQDCVTTLGYGPAKIYKTDQGTIIKMRVEMIKNLYAFSLLFLIFKNPSLIAEKKITSFKEYIKAYYGAKHEGKYMGVDSKMVLTVMSNWSTIFPKLTWKTVFHVTEDTSLHNQGITELCSADTHSDTINEKVQKILNK